MSNDQQEIEVTIEQAKKHVDMMNAVERLKKNRDFKKVILERYFEQEPSRLVMLRSDPMMNSPEHQEDLLKQMDGIGMLRQFLISMTQMGRSAEHAIQSGERELENIARDEMDGED